MSYKVLQGKNVPRGQESIYAKLAHDEAVARQARVEAERSAERQRERQKSENIEAVKLQTAERKRQAAERTRLAAAAQLDAEIRSNFFKSNPAADESAFQRLLPKLRDDHMLRKTAENFVDIKAKKRALYGIL